MSDRFVWPPSLRDFASETNPRCIRLRQQAPARGQGLLYGAGGLVICMGIVIALTGGGGFANVARAFGCILIGSGVLWRAVRISRAWTELTRTDSGWSMRQGVAESPSSLVEIRDADVRSTELAFDSVRFGFGTSAFKHVRVHMDRGAIDIGDGYRLSPEAMNALCELVSYKSSESRKDLPGKP